MARLCVGGMSFGERKEDWHQWTLDREETKTRLAVALDLGVNVRNGVTQAEAMLRSFL